MKKIAIIENIHKDGLKILDNRPEYEYELINDVSEENLIKRLPSFDACTLRVSKLNENILKHCSKLKIISRHGVGYDNIDLKYIKKKRHYIINYCKSKRCCCSRTCNLHDVIYIKKCK